MAGLDRIVRRLSRCGCDRNVGENIRRHGLAHAGRINKLWHALATTACDDKYSSKGRAEEARGDEASDEGGRGAASRTGNQGGGISAASSIHGAGAVETLRQNKKR